MHASFPSCTLQPHSAITVVLAHGQLQRETARKVPLIPSGQKQHLACASFDMAPKEKFSEDKKKKVASADKPAKEKKPKDKDASKEKKVSSKDRPPKDTASKASKSSSKGVVDCVLNQ